MSAATPNGLLLVDKPQGVTSHDVVARARRALRTRRIGHIGTLDPMATGLLLLAIGEATKLVSYLMEHDKRYRCTVRLGVETDSLDADGKVTVRRDPPQLDRARVDEVCRWLMHATHQVPPMVSAIKVDGQRMYQRARRGEVLELPPRAVTLHGLEVTRLAEDEIGLSLHCSKGFYVRALARDLCAKLGTVGHLTMLRRTHVGVDDVEHALAWETLQAAANGDETAARLVASRLVPWKDACRRLPGVMVDAMGADHARHGRAFGEAHVANGWPSEGGVAVLWDVAHEPIALARCADGVVTVARGFVDQRGTTNT